MKKILLLSPLVAVLFSGCFSTAKIEPEQNKELTNLTYQTTGTFKTNPIYGPALVEENFRVFMDVDGTKISPDYKDCVLETYSKGNLNPFRINLTPKKLSCSTKNGLKTFTVNNGSIIGSDNYPGIAGNIFERTGTKLANEATDEETKKSFANLKNTEILVIKAIEENRLNISLSITNE